MPVYEYQCDQHGAFTAMRPMREYQDPQPCPDCASPASRVMLSVPHLSGLSAASRTAHATNERAQHSPMTVDRYRAKHSPGCSCCAGGMRNRATDKSASPAAAKSFAGKRPWMISH